MTHAERTNQRGGRNGRREVVMLESMDISLRHVHSWGETMHNREDIG